MYVDPIPLWPFLLFFVGVLIVGVVWKFLTG